MAQHSDGDTLAFLLRYSIALGWWPVIRIFHGGFDASALLLMQPSANTLIQPESPLIIRRSGGSVSPAEILAKCYLNPTNSLPSPADSTTEVIAPSNSPWESLLRYLGGTSTTSNCQLIRPCLSWWRILP
jgi:hypothetical protein